MLYGHVHNTHDEYLINRFILETRATRTSSRYRPEPEPISCQMINCFCMFSDYQPMTQDEWIKIDRKRRVKSTLLTVQVKEALPLCDRSSDLGHG